MKRIICTSSSFDKESCIYVIREDVDLEKRTIVLKKNCALKFEGGILRNGIIVGDYTHIDALASMQIFDNVKIIGTWSNKQCSVCWFGAKSTPAISANGGFDCSESIQNAMLSEFRNVYFPVGNFYVANTIFVNRKKNIILAGHALGEDDRNLCAKIYTNKDIDVFFVCYDGYTSRQNVKGRSFKISGGKIFLYYAYTYSKSAIHLSTNRDSKIWGVDISTSICGKAVSDATNCTSYTHAGNGVLLDGDSDDKTCGYITDIKIKSYIYGFECGVKADSARGGGWITSMSESSTINWCRHAAVLNNCTNSCLKGLYQPLYGWNKKENGEALLIINTSNVCLACTLWDIGQGRKMFSNQYAVELGNVERISFGKLSRNIPLYQIKGFSTAKVSESSYEKNIAGKTNGFNSMYNCLQFGSPFFDADYSIKNATFSKEDFDKMFMEDSEKTKMKVNGTGDVVFKVNLKFRYMPVFLIGFEADNNPGAHFRTVELDVFEDGVLRYHDVLHPSSTKNKENMLTKYYFSFERFYFSSSPKITLTFKDAVCEKECFITLGHIFAKSCKKYTITPSGGTLYGPLYKEFVDRYGVHKKKIFTTDSAEGKTNVDFKEYGEGCILHDKTSLVGITKNFAGRIFTQNIDFPLVVDGDLPNAKRINPAEYCGYVKILHKPSGRFAYLYDGKWHDSEGFDFVSKRGLYCNRPKFKIKTNVGFVYYAIDLKKYCVWDGAKWFDLFGNEIK